MRYLITDLNIKLDGHKYGFVQNIIDFLALGSYEHQFFFLVNKSSAFKLSDPVVSQVVIDYLTEEEQASFSGESSALKKYAAQWKIIRSYCEKQTIDHLILMELDLYQVTMGKKSTRFKVSGIWFRPHCRAVAENKTIKDVLKHKLWMMQKDLLIRAALRNRNLSKIFVLNDQKVVDEMNHKCGQRFYYLPDPVFDYQPDNSFVVREQYNIAPDRVIFLVFGYIDERKNVLNIIRAMNALGDADASKVSLLIIGKFEPGFRETLKKELKPGYRYQVVMNDNFVSDGEMEAIFSQSDVSLRMNINFFGSSGIIGLAAKYNKPSIVSDFGIVAELTEEYGLGKLVDPHNVDAVRAEILFYLRNPQHRQIDGQDYYRSHDTTAYVKTLLDL